MSNRKLKQEERTRLRKAQHDGYLTYRYGSPAPVTLPRVFTGGKRRSMVSKAMDVLRDWRLSHFQYEGPTRAGLRSGLCLKGHSWAVADQEAAHLVAEALHALGAKRPTWYQGQPDYVTPRENCANCGGGLDDEAITNHDRFCSDECRTAMKQFRNDRYWYAAAARSKLAYSIARRGRIPERDCEWCGAAFQPAHLGTKACSPSCAANLRNNRIPDRHCRNPKCGRLFHPEARSVSYCCQACHREHQEAMLEPKACSNPSCGKMFQPRFAFEKFCQAKCRRAAEKPTLPPKPCAHCGEEFAPKKATSAFCSRSCASRARAEKGREPALICEEVTDLKKAA